MSYKMLPQEVKLLVEEEAKYWEDMKPAIREWHSLYMTRWSTNKVGGKPASIQTSATHQRVSQRVSALFPRAPAVDVQSDIRADAGDPEKAQRIVNRFFKNRQAIINLVTVNALVFPFAAFKLSPRSSKDSFERVELSQILPWDLIVDKCASTWDGQRFVGHKYMLPLAEAKEKFGAKDYAPIEFTPFLHEDAPKVGTTTDLMKYIEVVELYDFCNDRVLYWSAQFAGGEKWLSTRTKIEVDEDEDAVTYDTIPFRDSLDQPVAPIVPLILETDPLEPLRGYSYVGRFAAQAIEENVQRRVVADWTAKTAQQFAAKKGALTSEALDDYEDGIHGAVLEVELEKGETVGGVIGPVPQAHVPSEVYTYADVLTTDMDRATVVSPQARGEVMNVTAREVDALAAQASSQVGAMAVVRDHAIEAIASLYIIITKTFMDEPRQIVMDGHLAVVTPDDLDGAFAYTAHDLGAGPMAEKEADKEFAAQVVTALGLPGAQKDKIVKAWAARNKLPQDWFSFEAPVSTAPGDAPGAAPSLPAEV